jgi:hypothetical protein
MKHLRWQIILASILIFLSIVLYFVHYTIFRDAHHIFLYLLGDIAFVPIEVLLVTVIIHQVLSAREKHARMEKLNMVIGAFFSEVGTKLLTYFSDWDPKLDNIRKELMVTSDWTQEEFLRMSKRLKKYDYGIDIQRVDLAGLRTFLGAKLDFLVRLLENHLPISCGRSFTSPRNWQPGAVLLSCHRPTISTSPATSRGYTFYWSING